jgi:capsular polysaccharide transport system permease protein
VLTSHPAATPESPRQQLSQSGPAIGQTQPGPIPKSLPQTGPLGLLRSIPALARQTALAPDRRPLPVPRLPAFRFAAPAGISRLRRRHRGLLASFVLAVLVPVMVSGWYLWACAADQFASVMAFSVHREDANPAAGLLGGLAGFSGSGSSDTDVLNQYINSQSLVAEIDATLNLRAMWSAPSQDTVFAYPAPGSIESLVDYWRKMVRVRYDSGTRLIDVEVRAFAPTDAQAVASAILAKSTDMINRLNDVAAADSLRYARSEVAHAEENLVAARADVTRFRNLHQMVDPGAELAAQSGLITSLQQELTGAQVRLDMLRTTTVSTDRRLPQAERRVAVIEAQIAAERAKLGLVDGTTDTGSYADLVAEFERLGLERQFAQEAYLAARAALEVAQADVGRQGRYLAAHVLPTLPESARYPARRTMLAMVAIFALALWSVAVLVYYSLRDRR